MDPNANLERQREIAQEIVALTDTSEGEDWNETDRDVLEKLAALANELADLVLALHEWIRMGGFLPEHWEEARRRGVVPKQLQGEALLRLIEQRGTPTVVRQNGPTEWMMANYVLVTFADGFECGIAPDGSVSS